MLGQANLEASPHITQCVLGREKYAFLSEHCIAVTSPTLEVLVSIQEKFSIQSAFWERDNLLFYTTKNHWKYALLNG